jgi:hypothetical protein
MRTTVFITGLASVVLVPATSTAFPGVRPPPTQTQQPTSIGANERVDGIRLTLGPDYVRKRQEASGYHYVYIVSNDEQARQIASNGSLDAAARQNDVCYAFDGSSTESGMLTAIWRVATTPPVPPKGGRLGIGQGGKPVPPPPQANVRSVHVEQLVVNGDTATIQGTDAYVDLQTLGARLIGRTSAQYTRLARGPSGFDVYSKRDGDVVTFVVAEPKLDPQSNVSRGVTAQLSGGEQASSACGRLLVTLQASAGTGQMANALAPVQLPPVARARTDQAASSDGEVPSRQVRTRYAMANLSVSRLASDADIVTSVTFDWVGKELDTTVNGTPSPPDEP